METDVVLPAAEILERKDAKQVSPPFMLLLCGHLLFATRNAIRFTWSICTLCNYHCLILSGSVRERKRVRRVKRTKSEERLPLPTGPKEMSPAQATSLRRRRSRMRSRSRVMLQLLLLIRRSLGLQFQLVS